MYLYLYCIEMYLYCNVYFALLNCKDVPLNYPKTSLNFLLFAIIQDRNLMGKKNVILSFPLIHNIFPIRSHLKFTAKTNFCAQMPRINIISPSSLSLQNK